VLFRAWPYASISGATALIAFLALPAQSLPGKYLDGDVNLLIPYGLGSALAAGFAILLVLLTWGRRGEAGPPWRHLAVPPLMVILAPIVLAVCGGARSRWGTGLLCAAVAVLTHLALELPRRGVRALLLGGVTACAVVVAVSCQTPWRATDFRATGLPFYVADVPGFRLAGTYADIGVIFLSYQDTSDRLVWLDATISRGGCAAEACFVLPKGHRLEIGRPYAAANSSLQKPLPTGITIHPVSATDLASYPVSSVSLPD
jgi:hypothetical protein